MKRTAEQVFFVVLFLLVPFFQPTAFGEEKTVKVASNPNAPENLKAFDEGKRKLMKNGLLEILRGKWLTP